jgi:hypothetical protein
MPKRPGYGGAQGKICLSTGGRSKLWPKILGYLTTLQWKIFSCYLSILKPPAIILLLHCI